MDSQKSDKSASSNSSDSSQISVMSADSFRYSSKLTKAIDKIIEEEGIFRVRKKVSHEAKKINPATAPALNVSFANGSRKINEDYKAYKAEVKKIQQKKENYQKASKDAYEVEEEEPHQAAIKAAKDWCTQAVKAGKMRINFLQVHQEELKSYFSLNGLHGHIQQGEDNLRSANEATKVVVKHEEAIVSLIQRDAATRK